MPGLITRSSSSSSTSSRNNRSAYSASSSQHVPEDYPALNFPGYSEKPADELLEPIAVVGMGKLIISLIMYSS